MATNGKSGDNRRHGAVKNRSQVKNQSLMLGKLFNENIHI